MNFLFLSGALLVDVADCFRNANSRMFWVVLLLKVEVSQYAIKVDCEMIIMHGCNRREGLIFQECLVFIDVKVERKWSWVQPFLWLLFENVLELMQSVGVYFWYFEGVIQLLLIRNRNLNHLIILSLILKVLFLQDLPILLTLLVPGVLNHFVQIL